ncbi:hypothetical protein PHLCEN_2v3680 [Hermanssonia centrifuga]|uniref:Hydrophobin n=1 Tax=Hermanssonia centrifuga TaxID=98765 RepID=A0A2R6QEE6_9APHY|nr:hypothetical protein PHLCEN_2v3680 [Hermanssonia centrifuga]
MFARISATSLYVFIALGVLAVATPNPENAKRWGAPTTTPPVTTTITETVTAPASTVTSVSQCNTGPVQCCQSVQSASSGGIVDLLGLLGIVLQDLNVLVGLTCSPVSVIGFERVISSILTKDELN